MTTGPKNKSLNNDGTDKMGMQDILGLPLFRDDNLQEHGRYEMDQKNQIKLNPSPEPWIQEYRQPNYSQISQPSSQQQQQQQPQHHQQQQQQQQQQSTAHKTMSKPVTHITIHRFNTNENGVSQRQTKTELKRIEIYTMVRYLWFALLESTNHKTRMCNLILEIPF